jgi:formate-dependent nitrite reductase cytochrome c552 subunit
MVSKTCRRCGQVARYDDPFHRGFGALSRLDSKTMICSDCGVDEAMEGFIHGRITPMSEWPIKEKEV